MKAVIMAGGEGTRIRPVAGTHPKSMVRVSGKPVLYYQLADLYRSGIRDIIIVTGYLGDEIEEYLGDGSGLGLSISYYHEPYPMGTGGALYELKDVLRDDFMLLMGDLMMSADLKRFYTAHTEAGALVTLFTHPNSHPYDSDIIVTDEVGSIEEFDISRCGRDVPVGAGRTELSRPVTGFISKNDLRPGYYHNQVNAGLYMISPEVLKYPRQGEPGAKVDVDRDIVRPLISGGRVRSYRSTEYVRDMGTPERYLEVSRAVDEGTVEAKNLLNPQKCVFIDRDGTVNATDGFVSDPGRIELIPGAAEAISRLNASRYLVILITNQPVIARGEASFSRFDEIECALETALGSKGAYLDAVYYCPHHPDAGYPGEVRELKFICHCRKPSPGMILRAAAEHHIDTASSYMVGDSARDVLSGIRAGVRTIGLRTGRALADGYPGAEPDMMADSLYEAVEMILGADGR